MLAWSLLLRNADVLEKLAKVVAQTYVSCQLFFHAFRTLEKQNAYAKTALIAAKFIAADAADWDLHPAVAAL